MRCKEYFPKQEMKEGKDGYWRCVRKCEAQREEKQGATEQGGSQENGNG